MQSQLRSVLMRFSLEEIYDHVIDQIQDLNWQDVLNNLKDRRETYKRAEIIEIIVELIYELNYSAGELQGLIENLNLLGKCMMLMVRS